VTVTTRRLTLWSILGLALLAALTYSFMPQPVPADLVEARHGTLLITLDDEGETRVRDIYVLSAPVAGRALRIEAEAGDRVVAGETVVAEIEPIDPAFLDPRSEAQAQADINAAESARDLALARVDSARAELEFAESELQRARRLVSDKLISEHALDEAERSFKTRKAELATARAALQVSSFELERARAQLVSPAETLERRERCECIPIRAPVTGRILRVLHESEGVVAAGEPLVEIGNPGDLEIVTDLLSTDAVRAAAGQRVIIERWGGDQPLEGRVRRVEPFGFTKVSALGIEEQRVNVIIDITSPPEQWARLGHGYQLETRIVLSERGDALKLPLTALFRDGARWAVYVEESGRARLRHVEIGERSQLEVSIHKGLQAGEHVIEHPGNRIADGVRITPR
jgi:HlyD family secretion protein